MDKYVQLYSFPKRLPYFLKIFGYLKQLFALVFRPEGHRTYPQGGLCSWNMKKITHALWNDMGTNWVLLKNTSQLLTTPSFSISNYCNFANWFQKFPIYIAAIAEAVLLTKHWTELTKIQNHFKRLTNLEIGVIKDWQFFL